MSRGRKAARDRKYAAGSAPAGLSAKAGPPGTTLGELMGRCSFCHVGIGHWHDDDCLWRGPVKPEHAR